MPKTNAKVASVNALGKNILAKIASVNDNRSQLSGMLKSALPSKTYSDFNKFSMKTYVTMKEVEKEIKELQPMVANFKSEITSLNKLVADKGKSLTYRAQLAASKTKTAAFKLTVQWTKDVGDYRDVAEHFAATLKNEGLNETFTKLRIDLERMDASKFAADAPKRIKKVMDDLQKNTIVAASGQAVIDDGKRLSADPELDDDE